MNPPNADNLSNIDIAVYALYLLGGWRERVHTEDIALKCFELAPSKFSWVKYPEYPDNNTAYLSLGDAKKQKYGALVKGGSERKKEMQHIGGWKLTLHGVEWIEGNKLRIEESLGKHATTGERLDIDRKLKELRNSIAYSKFLRSGESGDISHAEFAESLVCTVNTSSEILNDRLEQLSSIAKELKKDDIEKYIRFCREKFEGLLK
jgi:predicted HTH domain antitoxin